ncbi:hypothetical protein [Flagellimonas flava]|uniref:hypothetical protein n=1 Tax=Flagellimonas flava TaxID=570519 RepID=UPI003D648C20
MIHPKTDPVGIDKVIDRIQNIVHDPLETAWGNVDVYGRVYRIQKQERVELQRYAGNGNYKPVLFSEGNKVFFVQGTSPDVVSGTATNDLWMVVIAKLDSDEFRKDEEAHELIMTSLSTNFLSKVIGFEYGMENLKRVVEDSIQGNFKYSDIHPYHVFMVKMNIEYSLIKNNC